ncbi:MAG: type III pantothenate kinase [Oscillospiraceae bacterium]
MILAVDIGNTHIVLGCMDGYEIVQMVRITTNKLKTDFEYAMDIKNTLSFFDIDASRIDGAIISSVVPPLTNNVAKAIKMITGISPFIVGKGVKTGVNLLIDDPAEAGADLVAAAAGAIKLYEPPLIIIDMGTATTITVLDKNGAFLGGSIAPGVTLGMAALSSGTSQLPNISFEPPARCIGTNTIDSMKSGNIFGAASMIDGMIGRIEAELGYETTVVATGGIASGVIPLCRRKIIINDDLLLYGLAAIYERNHRK